MDSCPLTLLLNESGVETSSFRSQGLQNSGDFFFFSLPKLSGAEREAPDITPLPAAVPSPSLFWGLNSHDVIVLASNIAGCRDPEKSHWGVWDERCSGDPILLIRPTRKPGLGWGRGNQWYSGSNGETFFKASLNNIWKLPIIAKPQHIFNSCPVFCTVAVPWEEEVDQSKGLCKPQSTCIH